MFLRQSTSQIIRFGPCLDITDGVTEETALTLAQADMRLSKDGAAFAQKSAAGNATHDSDGWYSTTLSTTDTATVGILKLNVHQPANMLPVWETFFVLEENVYDAWFAASGAAGTDLAAILVDTGTTLDTKINTIDTVVDRIEVDTQDLQTQVGTAGAGLTNLGASGNDWNTVVPDAAGVAPTTAEISDAVWDELLAGHVISDSAGELLNDWQNGGRLDLILDSRMAEASINTTAGAVDTVTTNTDMVAEAPTAAAIADAVWDESQSAHLTVGSTGRELALSGYVLLDTTVAGTPTSTTIELASGGSAVDDFYVDQTIIVTSGTGAGQARIISAYDGTTKIATIDEAFATTPGAGADIAIVVGHGHSLSQIQGGLATSVEIAALQADVTIMLGTTIGGACEGTPSTTSIQTNLTETTDDHFIGRIVVFTSGAAKDQATDITDYTGATGTLTVTALTTAPAASDTFRIV